VNPIVIATDLTSNAVPALKRGFIHARGIGAPVVVCHVLPDVMRHPLTPSRSENDLVAASEMTKRAAELVTEQVRQATNASPDDYRIVLECGSPEDEIVRIAEDEKAALIVIGAKERQGAERFLGQVAERVVRYSHTSVLVARVGHETGKVLVTTDFEACSQPALVLMKKLVDTMNLDATLLHVMEVQSSILPSVLAPLGIEYATPAKSAMYDLAALGKSTIEGLAKEYGARHAEQIEGVATDVIVSRAAELGVELIVMGSRGRKGLARLLVGSTAESVVRRSSTSVLVAR